MEQPVPKAIPAATVVVFRDAPQRGDAPQLLMVRRADTMVFAAGAVVFPGGRVDADDHYLAKIFAPTLEEDEGAARIAAIRETLEETGLAVGIDHPEDGDALADARKKILEGTDFSEVVRELGWTLQPHILTPFARWRPAHRHDRIFDTRFYLAHDIAASAQVSAQEAENSHAFWVSAREMLDLADRNESHIIFPTRRNLERLALFGSFAEAVEHSRRHEVRAIVPFFDNRNGESHLCIDSDLGYPVTSEAVKDLQRG